MKLYDNDAYRDEFMELVYSLLHSDGTNDRANQIIDAFDSAIAVEAEPILPNDPLTIDELLGMDGEPVFCVDGQGNKCWCLVNCNDWLPCCYDSEEGLWDGCFYGMTGDGKHGLHKSGWLAYKSKPENQKDFGGET